MRRLIVIVLGIVGLAACSDATGPAQGFVSLGGTWRLESRFGLSGTFVFTDVPLTRDIIQEYQSRFAPDSLVIEGLAHGSAALTSTGTPWPTQDCVVFRYRSWHTRIMTPSDPWPPDTVKYATIDCQGTQSGISLRASTASVSAGVGLPPVLYVWAITSPGSLTVSPVSDSVTIARQ